MEKARVSRDVLFTFFLSLHLLYEMNLSVKWGMSGQKGLILRILVSIPVETPFILAKLLGILLGFVIIISHFLYNPQNEQKRAELW